MPVLELNAIAWIFDDFTNKTVIYLPDSLDLVVNIDNIYVPFTCVATSSQNIPQLLRRNTL